MEMRCTRIITYLQCAILVSVIMLVNPSMGVLENKDNKDNINSNDKVCYIYCLIDAVIFVSLYF